MIVPYIIMHDAAKSISESLKLPFTGNEQDWDVEAADSSRVSEFLTFYKHHFSLTSDEKVALMALILASYDDLASSSNPEMEIWVEIQTALRTDWLLLHPLINYWSSLSSAEPDPFIVGVKLRELQNQIGKETV